MKYSIEIQPSGVRFETENNLLDDALQQEIVLEHSCKTGECGVCSAQIISGSFEDKEGNKITSGEILTCQSKAMTDSVIQAKYYPELAGIAVRTVPCKVSSYDHVSEDIVVLSLRLPPTAKFDYLAGQYIDLSFKGIKRSYSIANVKSDSSEIELHIRKVPNGQMSTLLWDHLKPNLLMRLEGPKGTFFLRESDKPLILMAGGTGIAPIKAIVEQLIAQDSKRDVYVYWGMPTKSGFFLSADDLTASKPNIRFIPVLSGSDDSWFGRKGFVHEAVIQDFDSLDAHEVYACGSPVMIDAAKLAFNEKNLPVDAFFSDAFTAAT
ncbi:CDP-6-deoxy-delta-3,4-glucoseen reductase [Vibrio breoganii]|uniref:CDP-6-deoxy-delta-3,4-glucoseen reductase n=1 Tax=Vibrio breoganii TaxID=553239 RepID=UPI000C833B7D|nr:CDP-6-deoxy-delta-3,4-glucoseen reductase [Vibrio breoganii]PML13655.1 CDP-6-deoxy-delta-3,4-glucoseen reductase [Vibrio breoganii]PMO59969.1 CDP-6-deoxy-delta-3,4-glucoseen reductase [Vibrio breoganii]